MAVFRWRQNWGSFQDLEREVDRLLESIKLPFPAVRFEHNYPPVNLYELEDEYLLVAELPGIPSESLELTVSGGVLTLKGVRPGPDKVADERFRRHERFHGPWQRSLSIPDRIFEEQVAAEFNDGILKIHLPKQAAVKPRQIPVVGNDEHAASDVSHEPPPAGASLQN
jgi:HSP20 family protein